MSRILTAYFSASGVTKKAAQALAGAVGGDLFEIEPAVPYTAADLNWMDKKSRSTLEMNDESSRPAVKSSVENMEAYETVFVGFPVWWYREPSIIDTFLEQYDFAGKTIVLFATSGSSGFGRTATGIRKLVSPQAKVVEGKVLSGRIDRKSTAAWVKQVAASAGFAVEK